jgi:hypothetical protein
MKKLVSAFVLLALLISTMSLFITTATSDVPQLYLADMISAGQGSWQGENVGSPSVVFSGKTLTLDKSALNTVSYKTKQKEFDLYMKLNAQWTSSDWGWFIYFRDSDGFKPNWVTVAGRSRYFIYAPSSTKIQLAKIVNGAVPTWLTGTIDVADMSNQDLECVLSVNDLESGAVKITFSIDGVNKIDFTDSTNPITTEGYITFTNHNAVGNSFKLTSIDSPNATSSSNTSSAVSSNVSALPQLYLADMISAGAGSWQGENIGSPSVIFSGKTLTLDKSALNTVSYKTKQKEFDLHMTMNAQWTSADWGWFINFRDNDGMKPNWVPVAGRTRYFIEATKSNKIQLGKIVNGADIVWLTGEIDVADMSGEDYDYILSVEDLESGAVKITFSMDGAVKIDFTDSTNPITTEGYITFINHNAVGNSFELTSMDSPVVPSSSVVSSSVQNVLPQLYLADMIGKGQSSWQGENIGSPSVIFSGRTLILDKSELNTVSYKIKQKEFELHMTLNAQWTSSDWGWFINFRDNDGMKPNWVPVAGKTRYFIEATQSNKIQLGKIVNGADATWLTGEIDVGNMSGIDLNCVLSVEDLASGAVKISFSIGGVNKINVIDSDNPIKDAGYITFSNHNLVGNSFKLTSINNPSPNTGDNGTTVYFIVILFTLFLGFVMISLREEKAVKQ